MLLQPFKHSLFALLLFAACCGDRSISFADDKSHASPPPPPPPSRTTKGPALGPDARVNSLIIDAWNAIGKNKIHVALTLSERVLIMAPNNGQALLFEGFCLHKLDRPKPAIECINRALKILPDSGRNSYMAPNQEPDFTYYTLAAALMQEDRKEDAIKVLNKAIGMFSNRPFLYAERGDIYFMMNDTDKAMDDYNSEIKLGEIEGTINRAKLLLHLKKPEAAIADLNNVIARQPGNSRYYAMRASAYKMVGKVDLAKKDFDKANELGRDHFLEE